MPPGKLRQGSRIRPLNIEEIEETGESFKQDLQREANRAVRRHDSNTALAALEGIEYVNKFVYTLKIRAGSRLGEVMQPVRAKTIRIFKKKAT